MRGRSALILVLLLAAGGFAGAQEYKPQDSSFIANAFVAWNTHDPDKVASFYTDDVVYEDVAFGTVARGRTAMRKLAADFFAAVPDLKLELVSDSLHNGYGAAEWVFSGTDVGLYKTRKKFSVRGASVYRMQGRKCSNNRDYYDSATIMHQVGLPSAATR